jgi:hypothetical protein
MIYVDTSVLVALCTREPKSNDVADWYQSCKTKLISSAWAFTEFASALSIKERTGQVNKKQSQESWGVFQQLCNTSIELLSIDNKNFYSAAILTLDSSSKLRSADALHLATAIQLKAEAIVTLDKTLARNSKRLKLKLILV